MLNMKASRAAKRAVVANDAEASPAPPTRRRISTSRNPFLSVQSQKVWLDAGTRERIERLHHRITAGLGIDVSLSILIRTALSDLEDRVLGAVPYTGPLVPLLIPSQEAMSLKVALLTASKGQL